MPPETSKFVGLWLPCYVEAPNYAIFGFSSRLCDIHSFLTLSVPGHVRLISNALCIATRAYDPFPEVADSVNACIIQETWTSNLEAVASPKATVLHIVNCSLFASQIFCFSFFSTRLCPSSYNLLLSLISARGTHCILLCAGRSLYNYLTFVSTSPNQNSTHQNVHIIPRVNPSAGLDGHRNSRRRSWWKRWIWRRIIWRRIIFSKQLRIRRMEWLELIILCLRRRSCCCCRHCTGR